MKVGDPLPPDEWTPWQPRPLAFDALYRAELPRLSRFFARRVAADDVLDMVHEAFRRLLRITSENKSPPDTPEAYLTQIAGNLVRDRHRRARSHALDQHVSFDEDAVEGLEPLGLLETRDAIARVDAALLELPERTREIFLLHRLGGHSYAEIAAARGVSVKAIEKHIARALFELRQRVRPHA
jgi:RNA polymerase sigma-70 factor (ECF subfamily)